MGAAGACRAGHAPVSYTHLDVYKRQEHKEQAEEVVRALGTGRAIVGAGYYEYETDVLVIIGKDWKPVA